MFKCVHPGVCRNFLLQQRHALLTRVIILLVVSSALKDFNCDFHSIESIPCHKLWKVDLVMMHPAALVGIYACIFHIDSLQECCHGEPGRHSRACECHFILRVTPPDDNQNKDLTLRVVISDKNIQAVASCLFKNRRPRLYSDKAHLVVRREVWLDVAPKNAEDFTMCPDEIVIKRQIPERNAGHINTMNNQSGPDCL